MTTHTPGPFEIDTDRSIICRPQPERYGRDMISDVLPIAGVYSWMGPEESDANARLFGAAPDLLAALRKFQDYYPSGINPELDDAFRLASDAIAKAEGRQ